MRPTSTDRACLYGLALRVREVAVDVHPRHVPKPWNPSPDPLAGLCGFAAIGVVNAAAVLGYMGGVLQGTHSRGSHMWARLDCGLDVDIAGRAAVRDPLRVPSIPGGVVASGVGEE